MVAHYLQCQVFQKCLRNVIVSVSVVLRKTVAGGSGRRFDGFDYLCVRFVRLRHRCVAILLGSNHLLYFKDVGFKKK